MARIEVSTHVEADPARVWALLTDWEAQVDWMRDAVDVSVRGDRREGVGVVLRCRTRIAAGLTVDDDLVTTAWDEPRRLEVRHTGWLIRGLAAFELEPTAHGTRVTWWEEIDPPLGPLGEALARLLAVPLVTRVFRSSLAAFKRRCESPAASGQRLLPPARRRVASGSAYEPRFGFSRALRAGDRVVVAGTAPIWPDGSCPGDAETQARRCFDIILSALAEAGAGPQHVVRTRMFLLDAADAEAVGRVHGAVFAEVRPAATMVVVAALVDPRWRVEIEAEAVIDQS